MPSHPDRTGSPDFSPLTGAFAVARAWAGPDCQALLLSGSHASGEAVWIEWQGLRRSLSDLDLYALMPSAAACRAGEARSRAARPGLATRLLDMGLAGPLEVAFLTARDLDLLPARPATLELARHARVIDGDPIWPRRVPAFAAHDVSAEEILLLLENRGFELLAAHAHLDGAPLERWRARHAVLKCALDLAGVLALERGEYPDGATARVEWARLHDAASEAGLDALWATALAWRRSPAPWESRRAAFEEWRCVVRAWSAVWERLAAPRVPGETDPLRRAVALAARARPRRRLRQALWFETRSGRGPGAWARWRFAARGTPQHRLNASAAVLLLAGGRAANAPELSSPARAALHDLGAVAVPPDAGFDAAAAAAVRVWDRWILDGQRTAEEG